MLPSTTQKESYSLWMDHHLFNQYIRTTSIQTFAHHDFAHPKKPFQREADTYQSGTNHAEFNPDILQPVHQAVLIRVRSDIHHHYHCLHFPYAIMLQPISKHEERNWIHCRNCNMKCEKQSPSTSNSMGESCICKKNSWSLLQQPDQLPIQFLV